MSRVNPTPAERKFDEGRLMQVLVAPVVSEKATLAAEKSNAVVFKVLQDALIFINIYNPLYLISSRPSLV